MTTNHSNDTSVTSTITTTSASTQNEEFWLLPEGVNALTPAQSILLEQRRRQLLNLYRVWGYRYVMTPLAEFIEPLLNGASDDLILQTQKVTDQLSGRLLGFRADITPQIARLDVHTLNTQGIARYCYADTVYHTRPKLSPEPTRLPFQTGIELFGHLGVDSDYEVIALMLESLTCLGIDQITLDLGHIGIIKNIFESFTENEQTQLKSIFCRKCEQDLLQWLDENNVTSQQALQLKQLMCLMGEANILASAQQLFKENTEVKGYLEILVQLVTRIQQQFPKVNIYIDLSETRGYDYHTGCVFAAYTVTSSQMIAKGGRYDGLAGRFGRERPATGFTIDLQQIGQLLDSTADAFEGAIFVSAEISGDSDIQQKIYQLRQAGEVVIQGFSQQDVQSAKQCNRQLIKQGNDCCIVNV